MASVEVSCAEQACRIRDRMDRVRGKMDREVDGLVEGANQLLNWKQYYRSFPIATLSAVAATAFLVAPRRKKTPQVNLDEKSIQSLIDRGGVTIQEAPRARPTLLASAGTLAANMAVRAVIAYAGQQFGRASGTAVAEETSSRP